VMGVDPGRDMPLVQQRGNGWPTMPTMSVRFGGSLTSARRSTHENDCGARSPGIGTSR
jgi:hypothetical protein